MSGVVICGGRRVESTIFVVGRGFERRGINVAYVPTRDYNKKTSSSKFSPIDDIEEKIISAAKSVNASLLIWLMCKSDYPSGLSDSIRAKLPSLVWAYHSFDDPHIISSGEYLRSKDFDFAITCCQGSIADYKQINVPSICLYPPYDEEMQTLIEPDHTRICDISFIATNMYPPTRFPNSYSSRSDIVRAVHDIGALSLYGPWDNRYNWGGEFGVPELKYCWRGPLRFEQLAPVYKSSKINLNSHVRPDGYLYLNERFTNVLGSGSFMLVDNVNGIDTLYDGQKGFEVYYDLPDLREKCKFYLRNETARNKIAQAGLALARRRFSNTIFADEALRFAKLL